MSAASPLLDLATQISEAARAVNGFLVAHDHPQPSFSADGQPEFPASAPADAVESRRKLIETSRAMYDMACWPSDHIRNMSHSVDTSLSSYFMSSVSHGCGLTH